MVIAELFIGAFITVLFEKLASGDLIRLARFAGIHSELNKWGNTLTQIQAVLLDAGQKHIREKAVQLWLNKLQHLAYKIDDVLDDMATEAAGYQVTKESYASSTSKVLKFIPTKFHAVKYGLKMKSKLDEITTKLDDLVMEKNRLGLNDNVQRSGGASRPLEETSLVDVSKVKGRGSDKQALLENLLSNESSSGQKVNVVSIVGLGGIGKTTLAQLLYNEKDVKDHFELMSWVCVSDEFDVSRISKAIFKDVSGDDQKFETLNQLQVSLAEKFSKKKFMIVLDDVWTENYKEWELLQRPFTVGAPGSKILVTTRKKKVADLMESLEAYPLKVLSNVEAISLFAEHALGKQNFDSHPTLKLLGEGIVKKCDGLPLALITLGRVLRTKSNDEEWEELLNSEFWSSDDGSKILPALKLSYYDLPSHLKQMFTYCCLFPKDYTFDKDELVLLWMGEGFLYESNGNKSMESFGRECFEELMSRSFFQHSTTNKSQYIMHDLINDLATSVAGEFFFTLGDKIDVNDRNEALEKLHHLSFIRKEYDVYKKFKPLQRARRMRTFLATSVPIYDGDSYLSNKVLLELLPQLQFLRVLSLANYYITDGLKHLRYLNVSNARITCLPEQVGDLHNLQSLLLFGCHELSTLPKSIVKLMSLRHLNITDTPELNEIPLGLDRLTSLQTLSRVIIGGSGGYKISDLKSLLHLRGQLSIERMHEVKNAVDAKEVNLRQKKGICDLQMKWSDVFDGSRNEILEYEVLEELRPFEKLGSLKIMNYSGTKFPSWVGDPSYVCLTHLTLRGCRGCTCLPALGNLPSLQTLLVESMHGLEILGSELLGSSNSCHSVAFPSLKVLEFKYMNGWEEWSTSGDDKAVTFPCLREISIIKCPKLEVMTIELIPTLKVLHVEHCSLVVVRSMVSVSSSISELKLGDIRGLTHLHGELLKHLKALEYLQIYRCDELTYLWESEVACKILVSLQQLEVEGCNNLVSLGEKDGLMTTISLESVRKVDISNCPRLENYICPNIIEILKLWSCPSVTSLTFPKINDLQSTLKDLSIVSCDNVEQSWLLNNFLTSLEHLYIWNMPNQKLFPEGCLVYLTELTIYDCDNIESIPDTGYGFLPSLCLRELYIRDCKNLKSFPHEHLQSLTSLERLEISYCPSMDDSFPCGLWPPNLSNLEIGGLKKPISEWGLQNFPTSLVDLGLFGEKSGVIPFAKAEDTRNNSSNKRTSSSSSFLLPPSLTCLTINDFTELESVSEGLQHLKCLEVLEVWSCPKLRDLPETLLPSLSRLVIDMTDCSMKLRKKCDRRKGKYWPSISQIPDLHVGFDG